MTDKLRQVLNNEAQKIVEAGGTSFVLWHGVKTYLKNLWYNASDPHDESKLLIVKLISGQVALYRGSFNNAQKDFGIYEATELGSEPKGIIEEWCYFDDILPDNK